MRQLVSITFNGTTFSAYPGDVLLDAALRAGVGMPHDCRSGVCEACVVRIVSGAAEGGEGPEPGTVRSCEARVLGDVEAETEVLHAPSTCRGRVAAITPLSEICARNSTPLRASPPPAPAPPKRLLALCAATVPVAPPAPPPTISYQMAMSPRGIDHGNVPGES